MSVGIEDLALYSREERIQFCRIVANMIAADHKITEEEQLALAGLVFQTGLSMTEEDVATAVNEELANPSSLSELLNNFSDPNLRRGLYRIMVEFAYADQELATEEEEKLTEMANTFGLNRDAAAELIRWTRDSIELERRELEIVGRL